MRIITWNINSLRLRLPLLAKLVAEYQPDVICLQETKVENALFPHQPIEELGYQFTAKNGMKSYNGVAILSRHRFVDEYSHDFVDKADCRHLCVTLAESPLAGLIIHNVYVPAGGDIPDPSLNEKFDHKLKFMAEMTDFLPRRHPLPQSSPMILVGDLNIAPLDDDVWSHKGLLDVVSHTPVEIEAMTKAQHSLPWCDLMREFVPPPQKLYTWWSYRNRDWAISNRGRRLDHVWVTPDLAKKSNSMAVLKEFRDAEKPSDHVPVMVDFDKLT